MKKIQQYVLVCLATILPACGYVETFRVMTGHPEHPHKMRVVLQMEAEPVPENFEEIAIIQSKAYGRKANLEGVLEGLKSEAQALGCTAVVRIRIEQGDSASGTGVCGILKASP